MKNHKNLIIAIIAIVAVLALVFCFDGDAPGINGGTKENKNRYAIVHSGKKTSENPEKSEKATSDADTYDKTESKAEENEDASNEQNKTSDAPDEKTNTENTSEQSTQALPEVQIEFEEDVPDEIVQAESQEVITPECTNQNNTEYIKEPEMTADVFIQKDQYCTEPVPEGNPLPIEPENAVITDKEHTCTLSVKCDTILQNIAWLDKEKVDIIPKDGVIFAEKEVTFYEGESVFNLLVREMKRNKIHLEFENVPLYNSAYIEGIANLYEFDCGELSGWMYRVNDWFPNYGCSRYQIKAGDRIEWVYTCNLGADIGGHYSARNGN